MSQGYRIYWCVRGGRANYVGTRINRRSAAAIVSAANRRQTERLYWYEWSASLAPKRRA